MFNHLGAPWKTEKHVRQLLEYYFTDTSFGIPGDEDGGGMSAFVVFSMMGFYPVVAGVPVYELGSPVFDKVTIKLHDGKTFRLVAKNTSVDNKYIKSVRLNGQPQDRMWFRHADVLNGLTISAEMSDTPNTALGAKAEDLPPSGMAVDPVGVSNALRPRHSGHAAAGVWVKAKNGPGQDRAANRGARLGLRWASAARPPHLFARADGSLIKLGRPRAALYKHAAPPGLRSAVFF